MGDGKFVLVEERDRQANLFTYMAGGILHGPTRKPSSSALRSETLGWKASLMTR